MPRISCNKFCLLTGSTHPRMAKDVARRLGIPLTPVNVKKFLVGEICPGILKSVRGKEAFVLATANTGRINDDLMETALLLHNLSLASITDIHLFMLAMPYLRQDRKEQPRVPISAEFVIRMLREAARGKMQSLITFDPHTIGAEAIMSAHNIPSPAALTTRSLFVDYIKNHFPLKNLVFTATDSGRIKWVRSWAEAIYGPEEFLLHYLPAEKVRSEGTIRTSICEREVDIKTQAGKWTNVIHAKVTMRNKYALIVDDMTDGGGSMITTAVELAKQGPAHIIGATPHAYLSGNAPRKLQDSPLEQLIVSNTLNIPESSMFGKLKLLDSSPLIAEIFRRIATNKSLEGYNLKV
ncbi:MAG: ribose-phosphate diphosphokinase [Candidatus Saganbacteria bacterium]|nr:ribose-phosphate diphosphokinase [Candidatus Saganbacteria bacterium]